MIRPIHQARDLVFSIGVAIFLFSGQCIAQGAVNLPNKTIRIIAPAAPGGILDQTSRLVGERLAQKIGQPVIVENKPGAGGMLGIQAMLRSDPDGATLVMGSLGPNAANYTLQKAISYKKEELAPVVHVLSMPDVLVVNANLPITNIKELREYALNKPGGISIGVSTSGSSGHLAGELVRTKVNFPAVNIIYKGASPALIDLVGGQVDMMVDNLITALPLIRQGKLRAIAVTSKERSAELPDIPTMSEEGYPEVEVYVWLGLFASADTPPLVLNALNMVLQDVLSDPELKNKIRLQGGTAVGGSRQQFASFVDAEIVRWTEVIKSAKLTE